MRTHLSDADRVALGHTADLYIGGVRQNWDRLRSGRAANDHAHELGWLGSDEYHRARRGS